MQARALVGTMLGTYALQKLVGRGSTSAVFLAQEAQSGQQVAVKVLWPEALAALALAAGATTVFLERFRRELAAVSSLNHENILPVFEYDVYKGLMYLVMPYISGGTLREVMEREGPLPLSRVAAYLDQLAAALDYAHERGIIHQDCKPSNVLVTSEGPLLLADFGLIKIVADRQTSQMRLLKASTSPGVLA